MQQVGIVGEQVIDEPCSLHVTWQGAQQVLRNPLPLTQPTTGHECPSQRPLIVLPHGDVSSRAQQGVI